jgi:hypothetical protein
LIVFCIVIECHCEQSISLFSGDRTDPILFETLWIQSLIHLGGLHIREIFSFLLLLLLNKGFNDLRYIIWQWWLLKLFLQNLLLNEVRQSQLRRRLNLLLFSSIAYWYSFLNFDHFLRGRSNIWLRLPTLNQSFHHLLQI